MSMRIRIGYQAQMIVCLDDKETRAAMGVIQDTAQMFIMSEERARALLREFNDRSVSVVGTLEGWDLTSTERSVARAAATSIQKALTELEKKR